MRLVGALLFVALTGSLATADDPKPADPQPEAPAAAKVKVPLRVVRVMAETHQALLYDKNRGTHVLAEVGKTVDGFLVDDVDDDSVTLVGENGVQLVLAAPEPARPRHHEGDDDTRSARPARLAKKDPQPIDPYAAPAPVDPYAETDTPVRSIEAPGAPARVIEPGEGGVRTVEAPDAAPVASRTAPDAAPASRPAPAPTPGATTSTSMATSMFGTASTAPTSKPATRTPPKASAAKTPDPTTAAELADVLTGKDAPAAKADGPVVLARADVDAALANFGSLSGAVHGSFTPAGAKLESVAATSLFAKAGLRAGDIITSVDGQAMRSLDDAANIYARAGSVRSMTLQITRAGKPMTLRVAIQ